MPAGVQPHIDIRNYDLAQYGRELPRNRNDERGQSPISNGHTDVNTPLIATPIFG